MADSKAPDHAHAIAPSGAPVRGHKAPACLYPILYGASSPGWEMGATRPVFRLSPRRWSGRGGQSAEFLTFAQVTGLNGRP